MERYRPPDRSKYLLKEEIAALVKAVRSTGEFEYQFLKAQANTGMRPSEANQVRVQDVHTKENRIRVNTLKQKKGKTVVRDIDLAPDYARELADWLQGRAPAEKLFPRSRVTFWSIFKRAAAQAGLSKTYTLYGLRHSRCIYLLEWTGDLVYTSQQMGHSSLDITKVYLHCLPSKREEIIQTKLKSL